MREDIQQLICNYWDLHGTFNGIEKTVLVDEVQKMGGSCGDMLMNKYDSFDILKKQAINHKIGNDPDRMLEKLTNEELQSVLLAAHYIISSPKCVVKYNNMCIRTALFARNIGEYPNVRRYIVAEAAAGSIVIEKANTISMYDNVLFTPCNEEKVRDNIRRLVSATFIVCTVGLSNEKLFVTNMLNRGASYYKVVALAEMFGLTVNDFCCLYNCTMPDMIAGYEAVGEAFVVFEDNVVLFNEKGSEYVDANTFAAKYMHKVYQKQALQQLGAF